MKQVWGNERGIALGVAMLALVVVGALVAGALFVGTQEQRVGENQHRLQQSFDIAEGGAPELIRGWSKDSFNVLRFYPLDTFKLGTRQAASGKGTYGGSVWKLNRNLYLFDVTGSDTATRAAGQAFARRGSGARQRIGIIARLRPLQLPQQASLTTQGNVNLVGTSSVDGTDQIPNASWTTCAPPDTTKAGIRTTPGATVAASGAAEITGSPPVAKDPAVAESTFTKFGDVTWDMLTAQASIVLSPGNYSTAPVTSGTTCVKSVITNWGDGMNRAAPCGNYFPIVHIRGAGTTTINNTQGQGILLIDGDVTIQGSYQFFGIVIIRGSLTTAGGGSTTAHFFGMVMAANLNFDTQQVAGRANLNYSKCAVMQALEWTGLGATMRSRGFVTLNN